MKIYRKETSLDISELNLNDYYLILGMIDAIHKLLSDNELSSFIDNQEKEKLQEDVERILFELSKERGIKIAESQAETIIRKVIEKATKN